MYRQNLVNRFWRRWLTEYLPQLTIRQKWLEEKPPLGVGDIVLMSEDNVKRGNWPLAVVEEIHKGKDGLIRTVTIRTKSGRRRRSVQKLYLLEEAHSGEKDKKNDDEQLEQSTDSKIAPELPYERVQNQKAETEQNFDTKRQGGENVKTMKYTRSGRKVMVPERLII